jgi:DNA modification methylase
MTSIKDLKSDHKNARKRTDRSASLIAESLQRYGAARSIVIDEENRILAGNGTIEGAKAAGIKNVRVIETDGTEIIAVKRTGLSEDEKIGLALADNRTSDLSDWDKDMLQQLSDEHDLAPWFDADDLAEILGEVEQLPAEGLTDADDVPEAPEEPVAKPGDLWVLGDHRLLCGDSTSLTEVERLMDGKKADMVFTDPPYGVEYRSNFRSDKAKRFEVLQNDDKILDIAPVVWDAMGENTAAFIWTSHHVYPVWRAQFEQFYKQTIVWQKSGGAMGDLQGQYAVNYELALFCAKGSPKFRGSRGMAVWEIGKDAAASYVHPTQKPVALAERALADFSDKRAVVLDLFGGSGSTLIACEKTGRHARLMELDPAYCDVIIKRWEDFTGKKAILEEAPEAF